MDRAPAAVLFDLDDTLHSVADMLHAAWASAPESLRALGLEPRALHATHAAALHSRTPAPLRAALDALDRPDVEVGLVIEIALADLPNRLGLRPGARECLLSLRSAGVPVGLVSNGDHVLQKRKLDALGITHLLDTIVVAPGAHTPAKPHPAPFLLAADALGVPASGCVMVGDRVDRDVAPALSLGMRAFRLRRGSHAHQAPHPEAELDTDDSLVLFEALGSLVRTPMAAH